MYIDPFVKYVQNNNLKVYGIELSKSAGDREEVIEKYNFVTESRHPIYSATKSFLSTACGLAVDDGYMDIDKSIFNYIGEYIPANTDLKVIDVYKKLTVKRFLTMSVKGYPFRPEGDDWVKSTFNIIPDAQNEPGFDYSNIPAYLVGLALENAIKRDVYEYLDERVFEPLGIDKPKALRCPAGHFYGASGMELTVNELSRLGHIYLNNGAYNGNQIISKEWVHEATSVQIMNREGGYGYYFWKLPGGFLISGKWGQKCYAFADKGIMITFLSDERDSKVTSELGKIVMSIANDY